MLTPDVNYARTKRGYKRGYKNLQAGIVINSPNNMKVFFRNRPKITALEKRCLCLSVSNAWANITEVKNRRKKIGWPKRCFAPTNLLTKNHHSPPMYIGLKILFNSSFGILIFGLFPVKKNF